MDSGRFLLAVVLMIALVVVTNILLPPVPRAPLPAADSAAVPPLTQPVVETPTAEAPPPVRAEPPVVSPVAGAADPAPVADTVVLESDLFRYAFSTAGAAIVSAELKPFESQTRSGPVELKPDDASAVIAYRIQVGQDTVDLSRVVFTSEADADGRTLRFVHPPDSANPLGIEFVYTVDPENYLLDVRGRIDGTGAETPRLLIDLPPRLRNNEANPRDDEHALAYVVNNPTTGIQRGPLRDVRADRIEEGPLLWTALKNKYFLAAVIRSETAGMPFGGLIVRPGSEPNTAQLTTTLLAGGDGELSFRLYLGPQQKERLIAIGHDLRDVNPFGWKPLQPLLRPLGHAIEWALEKMHSGLGLGYGWVLVLFGVLIRVVLWPLNAKAMRSQLKNMEMQPRLKEIQTKYKTDPERLQKEMLRLYREEGFNPMGGCLPLLIPFPILITLFFVFQSTISFRGVSFLWLPDLSRADPFYILPVLLGLSMFALQWLSMRTTKDANPQMKVMMYVMPVFMTVLFLNFASGLNLYYAAMNLASVPQQLHVMNERKRWQATRAAPAS